MHHRVGVSIKEKLNEEKLRPLASEESFHGGKWWIVNIYRCGYIHYRDAVHEYSIISVANTIISQHLCKTHGFPYLLTHRMRAWRKQLAQRILETGCSRAIEF